MKHKFSIGIVLVLLLVLNSCTTTKKKGEVSKFGKAYHNTTAQYNGYFNANELYLKSILVLNEMQKDNYTQILPIYTYRDVADASSVGPDLDIAIEKVSKVINLHRVSAWTDDCYLLLGKAQYLKQDFETAEKTFEFFVDEMNPIKLNPPKKAATKKSTRGKKKKSSRGKKKTKEKAVEKKASSAQDGGLFAKDPAYNEGLVWMAKTYIERERWPSAAYMIGKLESSQVNKEVARQIPVVKAYYFIEQKNYAEAVPSLQKAIEMADRDEKARYAYILAQIYEGMNNEKGAYDMYNMVIEETNDYEMEFNAQLNLFKNATGGKKSESSILKSLERLLKEEKFSEYRDQIYFTRAEIKFKKGEFAEAFKDYQLSLQNNFDNDPLKAEVYYKLGNKFYVEESYLEAKNYFDSTLQFMPNTDDRHFQVNNYVQNLNQIAINLALVQLQDSLIRVSKMPREEQEKLAFAIKKKRDEVRRMQLQAQNSGGVDDRGVDRTNAGKDLSKVSTFFAYNPNLVRIGKLDFQRKWDDRALEDDWRRSNKQGGAASLLEELEEEEEIQELSDAEFKSILKDVPFTEASLKIAEDKIKKAKLELGILFREKLQNYNKSSQTLASLLDDYPGFDEECKAMYYLHLSYKNLGENTRALGIRNRMVGEYPDCSFTQVLTDPDFLDKQMKLLNKKDNFYRKAYALFEEDKHEEALKVIHEAPTVIGDDPDYMVKFDMLEAFCLGKTKGKDEYIASLENLVKRYPNTPEEIKAKEILRFLKGDSKAFENLIYQEGAESFVMEPDKLHYIFVILYGLSQEELKEAKRSVSKYNGKFHKLDRLRISNIYLDTNDEIQIILVRSFDNQEKAMKYFYQVESKDDEFMPEDYNYEVFAISQKNYREVIKQRTVNAYREFFARNYVEAED